MGCSTSIHVSHEYFVHTRSVDSLSAFETRTREERRGCLASPMLRVETGRGRMRRGSSSSADLIASPVIDLAVMR